MKLWTITRAAVAASVMTVALVSCSPADGDPSAAESSEGSDAMLISPHDFATAIADPNRVTINVHVPFEGDVPGTDVSIPFDQIAQRADELPADLATPLAIYCRSGPMSTTAAADLAELGYTDVVELEGGMKAWQASGFALTGI